MIKEARIIIVAGTILALGVLFFVFTRPSDPSTVPPVKNDSPQSPNLLNLPIFTEELLSLGINLDELGFHDFSPDGRYFVFTGIKDTDAIPAKTYLVTTATGEVKQLPGILLRGFEDSRIVVLFKDKDLLLYDPKIGTSDQIATDGNVFVGALSPDGTQYVFDTLQGIRRYNRTTKTTDTVTTSQYDGATAWFSDNVRMLGYKDTGESAFDAGNAKQLGIWNINTKAFVPLAIGKIPAKTIGSVSWIIPEKIARINTGWDDGSHDYLLNMQTGEVADLGDTSSAIMGGLKEDLSLGLFAIVDGYGNLKKETNATIYKDLDKVSGTSLSYGYIRENVQIVNQQSLLYIRKHLNLKQIIDGITLVVLDMDIGTETVLKELSNNAYSRLSLAPDHKTWVVSSKNRFYIGKLE